MSKLSHEDIEAKFRNDLQQELPKKYTGRTLEQAFEKYLELEPDPEHNPDPDPEKVRNLELELQDIITGRKNCD